SAVAMAESTAGVPATLPAAGLTAGAIQSYLVNNFPTQLTGQVQVTPAKLPNRYLLTYANMPTGTALTTVSQVFTSSTASITAPVGVGGLMVAGDFTVNNFGI